MLHMGSQHRLGLLNRQAQSKRIARQVWQRQRQPNQEKHRKPLLCIDLWTLFD